MAKSEPNTHLIGLSQTPSGKTLTFRKVDESLVVLHKDGVYKVCDVYVGLGMLYAKYGGGYVRLRDRHGTSIAKVSWHSLEVMGKEVKVSVLGNLELVE